MSATDGTSDAPSIADLVLDEQALSAATVAERGDLTLLSYLHGVERTLEQLSDVRPRGCLCAD